MINYDVIGIGGAHTEGFNAVYENGVLNFGPGSLFLGVKEYAYPEGFNFDVVGDSEIPVLYSVFLTQINGEASVAVDRIEMLEDIPQSPEREEGEQLLHLLCRFEIPAKSNDFDIEVRLLERVVENEDQG